MSTVVTLASRATALAPFFEAFRVWPGRTLRLAFATTPRSLDEAIAGALMSQAFHRGESLLIRETDPLTKAAQLHVFAIKQKGARWVHPQGEMMPRRVEDRYADPVCVIDEGVLAGEADEPRPAA
jgi:hypothetical protein